MKLGFYILYGIERIYLSLAYNLFPFMLIKSMSKRTGMCIQCGHCCYGCYNLKDNKCIVYKDRPNWCHKDFPVNSFERYFFASKDCGYSFKGLDKVFKK